MVRFETRPSGGRISKSAWSSTLEGVESMPVLFMSAMILGALLSVATFGFPFYLMALLARIQATDSMAAVGMHLSAQAISTAAWAVIAAPVAVAMHRLILLGERTGGVLSISAKHTRLFFVWLVAIRLIFVLGGTLASLPPSLGAKALLVMVIGFSAIVCSVYLAMVFPAVATDVPSPNVRARIKTSGEKIKGNFWLFVRAAIITFLPITILTVLVEFLFLRQVILHAAQATAPGVTGLVAAGVMGCLQVFAVALGAAVASWLYAWARQDQGETFTA